MPEKLRENAFRSYELECSKVLVMTAYRADSTGKDNNELWVCDVYAIFLILKDVGTFFLLGLMQSKSYSIIRSELTL